MLLVKESFGALAKKCLEAVEALRKSIPAETQIRGF